MRIYTEKDIILRAHKQIEAYMSNVELMPLNEKLIIARYVIEKSNALKDAINVLPNYIKFDNNLIPNNVLRKWEEFIKVVDKFSSQKKEIEYIELLKLTSSFLDSVLKQIPNSTQTVKDEDKAINKTPVIDLKKSLSEESKKLDFLLKQLEQEKSKESPNEDKLKAIEEQIDELKEKGRKLRNSVDKSQEETMLENALKGRIEEAFKTLEPLTTQYECERKIANKEYNLWKWIMIADSIILMIWYYYYFGLIIDKTIKIDNIISIIPFSVPTMLGVALFWISIVQKNRASNLSLTISEKLFSIHYLEKLLMFVNEMSPSSSDAIKTINLSVNKILDHYIDDIGKNKINIGKLTKVEKEEMEATPLIDIINKLIDKTWK